MEKLFEKKNLGIPVTILSLVAYFIGYYLTLDYSALLVAVIFAVVVFALDFDDRVKTSVKQAYFVGLLIKLIYLALAILRSLTDLVTPTDYSDTFFLQKIFSNVYRYASLLLNIAVIIIFALFIILVMMKKDLKLGFIANLSDEVNVKQKPMQPIPQPMPPAGQPMPQQMPPAGQPMPQQMPPVGQPMPPKQQVQGNVCAKCGTLNRDGAAFCASCGTKL